MQIVSVRLVNYRCFRDSGEVPLNKFSVLIGKNDGGKTSFLQAIEKVLNHDVSFESADCWFEVIDGEEKVATQLEVYIKLRNEKEDSQYHIRTVFDHSSTIWELEDKLVGDPRLNEDFHRLTVKELKEICSEFELQYKSNDSKPTLIDILTAYRNSLPKTDGWRELPSDIKDILPSVYMYASIEDTGPEKAIETTLDKFFKSDLLTGHQKSLSSIRQKVEQDLNGHAKTNMLKALKQHCSIVEDISIELDESSFTRPKFKPIRITQPDGKTIDWNRIGAGKKREMALGIFRWENKMLIEQLEDEKEDNDPNIILFDEPDINLDYSAQRTVNQLLQDLARYPQTQVVVATHAVNIIDSVPLQSLNFFEDTFEPWRFEFGSEDENQLETIRQALGLSNSSLFNEKLIVVVEGATEMAAIPLLYQYVVKQMLLLSGIYLINGLDKQQALEIAKLLRKGNKEVILLLDSDCIDSKNKDPKKLGLALSDPPTTEEIKNIQVKYSLKLNEELFFLGEMEFEDMFSDEVWSAMLKECYPVTPENSDWTEADIANLRSNQKFSGAIIDLIDTKCSYRPGKPEIGRQIAKTCISLNEIPETISLIFSKMSSKLN